MPVRKTVVRRRRKTVRKTQQGGLIGALLGAAAAPLVSYGVKKTFGLGTSPTGGSVYKRRMVNRRPASGPRRPASGPRRQSAMVSNNRRKRKKGRVQRGRRAIRRWVHSAKRTIRNNPQTAQKLKNLGIQMGKMYLQHKMNQRYGNSSMPVASPVRAIPVARPARIKYSGSGNRRTRGRGVKRTGNGTKRTGNGRRGRGLKTGCR